MSDTSSKSISDHDVLWGAARIGEVLGLKPRQAWYMLERGLLPAAKIGNKWSASRRALLSLLPAGKDA